MFYIGFYREYVEKTSCLKPHGLEPYYLVCSINKWISTKFVQIIPLGLKMVLPWGSHVLHRLKLGKHEKTFLSETTRPGAMLFYF